MHVNLASIDRECEFAKVFEIMIMGLWAAMGRYGVNACEHNRRAVRLRTICVEPITSRRVNNKELVI